MLLFISFFVFVTVALLLVALWMVFRGEQTIQIEQKEAPEDGLFDERLTKPLWPRLSMAFYAIVGPMLLRLTPKGMYQKLEEKLIAAGGFYGMRAGEFLAGWVATSLCSGLICSLLAGGFFYNNVVMLSIWGLAVGMAIPLFILNRRIQRRKIALQRALPGFLDMTHVSVQAGLSFDGALEKISERMQGPLVNEFTRALQEIKMGVPRRTAFRNLADRCRDTDVPLFIAALLQGEQLGVSTVKILETQADSLRRQRRTLVKTQAMKAPVKLVFPLVLFVMPALFVIILGPIFMNLKKVFP